jgi:hypothetical protein
LRSLRIGSGSWDAASGIARDILADRLAEQALDGLTDTITRAGGETVTRHRFDTRLSIAVLHRLDKRCDRAAAELAMASGARAEWLPFLKAVGTGDEAAATAIAFPPPAPPAAETAPHCQPCLKLDGVSMDDMSPAERIKLMQSIADGSLEAEHDRLAAEAVDHEDLSERVWVNDEGPFTNFPPPAGFDGFEQKTWGDDDYYRTLTRDELERYAAMLAEWATEDEAEIAEERAEDEARRAYFFGEGDEEEEGDEPPASDDPSRHPGEGPDPAPETPAKPSTEPLPPSPAKATTEPLPPPLTPAAAVDPSACTPAASPRRSSPAQPRGAPRSSPGDGSDPAEDPSPRPE